MGQAPRLALTHLRVMANLLSKAKAQLAFCKGGLKFAEGRGLGWGWNATRPEGPRLRGRGSRERGVPFPWVRKFLNFKPL